jgi:hypothetical protein
MRRRTSGPAQAGSLPTTACYEISETNRKPPQNPMCEERARRMNNAPPQSERLSELSENLPEWRSRRNGVGVQLERSRRGSVPHAIRNNSAQPDAKGEELGTFLPSWGRRVAGQRGAG